MHTLGLKSRTEGRAWAEKLEASFLDHSLTPRDFGQDVVPWFVHLQNGEELQESPSQGFYVAHKHSSVPFLLCAPPPEQFKKSKRFKQKIQLSRCFLEKREIGTTDLISCRTEEAGVVFWPSQGTGPGSPDLHSLPARVPPRSRVSCL